MAEAPPSALQQIWIDAVRLPGFDDAKASCLAELSEYTGLSEAEVEERCRCAVDDQRDAWYQADRSREEELVEFYNGCDAYLFELLWWHALEQGLAPSWNARLVDIAERFGCRRFLDFGAGIGTNSILMAQAGLTVTNADISEVMQQFARWRLHRRGIEAAFIDLKSAALPREAYDLISAVDVLEHVSNPLEALATLHDALAPGGVLVFDVIASRPDSDRPFHLMRSKYPIRSRIRELGFRYVESFQKYVVYQRAERSPLARRCIGMWDRVRWRTYYAIQGQWPAVGR